MRIFNEIGTFQVFKRQLAGNDVCFVVDGKKPIPINAMGLCATDARLFNALLNNVYLIANSNPDMPEGWAAEKIAQAILSDIEALL